MRPRAAVAFFLLPIAAGAAELEIRVVYDNTSAQAGVREDWGYAAVVTFRGKRLLFDAASAKISNLPEANRLLTREYRKGWELRSEPA